MKEISLDDLNRELCAFVRSSIVDKHVDVAPDTSFNQLGIDSLSIIELVLFLERKFNITLPEEALLPENFKTVTTLAECAIRYRKI